MTKRITKNPCFGGVYRITCVESGKSYIGSTKRPFRIRWKSHRYELNRKLHCNSHLQRSWNKYGESSFEFYPLEPVQFVEDLIDREQAWIDIYQAHDRAYGFNIESCADRHCLSEETKAKISAANTGKKRTPEQVARCVSRKHTAETKAKLSVINAGKTLTEETKAKISATNTKKQHTPEAIARMVDARARRSLAQTGKRRSPETIAKMRLAATGKPLTYESRVKMVASQNMNKPFYYRATAPDGAIHVVPNLREFCRKEGLDHASMSRCANKHQKQYKGWTCHKLLKPADQPSTSTPSDR